MKRRLKLEIRKLTLGSVISASGSPFPSWQNMALGGKRRASWGRCLTTKKNGLGNWLRGGTSEEKIHKGRAGQKLVGTLTGKK